MAEEDELRRSWEDFRRSSVVGREIVAFQRDNAQRQPNAHLPAGYQAPDKVKYEKRAAQPAELCYEPYKPRLCKESVGALVAALRAEVGACWERAGGRNQKDERGWGSQQSEHHYQNWHGTPTECGDSCHSDQSRFYSILCDLGYLSARAPQDQQLYEQQIWPAFLRSGHFSLESVCQFVCTLEFASFRQQIDSQLLQIDEQAFSALSALIKPFGHIRYNRMARQRAVHQKSPGAEIPKQLASRATLELSKAQQERELAYLNRRIPLHNQKVTEFADCQRQMGNGDFADAYENQLLIPLPGNYSLISERSRYQAFLSLLRQEEAEEKQAQLDDGAPHQPNISKSMISYQLAQQAQSNAIKSTKAQELRSTAIQARQAEDVGKKDDDQLFDSSLLKSAHAKPQQQDLHTAEEKAISKYIQNQRRAKQMRLERQQAVETCGRTKAGSRDLKMTQKAIEVTKRLTSSSRKQRQLLFQVDIELSKGKMAKISVYEGDEPAVVAVNFCRTYQLGAQKLLKINSKLQQLFESNQLQYTDVQSAELADAYANSQAFAKLQRRMSAQQKELPFDPRRYTCVESPFQDQLVSSLRNDDVIDSLKQFLGNDAV